MTTTICCAECGEEGGDSLKMCMSCKLVKYCNAKCQKKHWPKHKKTCKSCMLVKYCNAECQKKHWPKHKKDCKIRAAELRDEALFSVPPPKEDCPICFLPMPSKIIYCTSLPPATTSSIPIYDYMKANVELADVDTDEYFPCCGKSICGGCVYSFRVSGNMKCPFCNPTEMVKQMKMKLQN